MNQRKTGVLLTYVGEAIKIATALIYTPVMLRILGQSEYGLYQLVGSVVSYLSLFSLGFGGAYVRYHARYATKNDIDGIKRLNGMFLLIFSSMSALCLLCGGVMAANTSALFSTGLSAAELSRARILLVILVINMAMTFPNSVFDSYVTAHEEFLFQKLLRIVQGLLNPFLTLPLLLLGYGSVAMVLISTLLTAVLLIVNIWYCIKKLNMRFCFSNLQMSLLKEMWVFTFFIFLAQIIDQVNWSVDKFLLGRMKGTEEVAVYGVGGQINSLYLEMSVAISAVFIPRVNRIVASSDDNLELTNLMTRVGRVQFLVLGLILTGFVFFGEPFIKLWAGDGYEQAYNVALVLMIPVTIPLTQNLGIEIQRAKNKHRVRSIVYACLAIVNVVSSVLLIPRLGSVGAAWGTAISLVLGNILFMNWYYHKRMGMRMDLFWKGLIALVPALLLACLCGWAYSSFVEISSWAELIIAICIYVIVYVLIVWLLGMNQYEKSLVTGMLKKVGLVRE